MKSMRMLAEETTSLQQTSSYPYGEEKDKNKNKMKNKMKNEMKNEKKKNQIKNQN